MKSFNDFVGGWTPNSSNNIKKPYIYVMEYILSKENPMDELKEYILNYNDEETDYEDNTTYDFFMKKLKEKAMLDEFDEIEDMILSYDSYSDDRPDFDSDDDNFEEKLYDSSYDDDTDNYIDEFYEQDDDELDLIKVDEPVNGGLSEELREFLKVDIEFEDLGKDEKTISDIEFEELDNVILDPKYDTEESEKIVKELLDEQNPDDD